MSTEMQSETNTTRPYLIRALHEWCTDNGFTPYITVAVDGAVQVPKEYVKGGEIVLNVGFDATTGLRIGNDYIEFKARFGGVAREILIPVGRVIAIFARENGQGMAFAAEEMTSSELPDDASRVRDAQASIAATALSVVDSGDGADREVDTTNSTLSPKKNSKPSLTRIK